jgi:hypothetical protein
VETVDYVLYGKQQGVGSDGDDNRVVDGKDHRDEYLPDFWR